MWHPFRKAPKPPIDIRKPIEIEQPFLDAVAEELAAFQHAKDALTVLEEYLKNNAIASLEMVRNGVVQRHYERLGKLYEQDQKK